MKTDLTYYACVRCQKISPNVNDFSRIVSGYEMVALWCNDCITKHLNSSVVTN